MAAKFGRDSPNLSQRRPNLAEFCQSLVSIGEHWRTLVGTELELLGQLVIIFWTALRQLWGNFAARRDAAAFRDTAPTQPRRRRNKARAAALDQFRATSNEVGRIWVTVAALVPDSTKSPPLWPNLARCWPALAGTSLARLRASLGDVGRT